MAKQPRRDNGFAQELEAAFEEVLTSAARAAAARCAEVCRARVEEARSEERVRILLEPRDGDNGELREPLLLEAIPVAWTRGFYDGKFARGSQGLHCKRSVLGQPTTDLSAMVYPSDNSSQGGDRGLDYVALLRSTFAIRESIHQAVLAKSQPEDRPKSKRTCDFRTIVNKVHAVWQDRLLLEDEAPATLGRAMTADSIRELEPEQKVFSARSRRSTATALARGSVSGQTLSRVRAAQTKSKLGSLKEKVSLGLEAFVHSVPLGRSLLHHAQEEGGEATSPGGGAAAQGPRVSPGSLPPSPEQSPSRKGGGSPLRDASAEAAPVLPTEASPAAEKGQATPVSPATGSQPAERAQGTPVSPTRVSQPGERAQALARAAASSQLAAPALLAQPTSPFRKPEAPAGPVSPVRAAAEQPVPPPPPQLDKVLSRAEALAAPASPARAAAEQLVRPPPPQLERVLSRAEGPAGPVSPVRATTEQPAPPPPLLERVLYRAEAPAGPRSPVWAAAEEQQVRPPPSQLERVLSRAEAPVGPRSPVWAAAEEQPVRPPPSQLERVLSRAEAPDGPVSPARASAEPPVRPPQAQLERVLSRAEAPVRPLSPIQAATEQPVPPPSLERVLSSVKASAAPAPAAPPASANEPPGLRPPQVPAFFPPRRLEATEPPELRARPRALSRGATVPVGPSSTGASDAMREQFANNRDLSRTLAELTALLQEAHIIGTSPRTSSPARREGGELPSSWKLR